MQPGDRWVENTFELVGTATRALMIVAAVIIAAPFMVIGWAAYRMGVWK